MRIPALLCGAAIGLAASIAAAQPAQGAGPQAGASAGPEWSVSAAVYTYVVPEDDNFVQPEVAVDRDWLHIEARFNYEDIDTASAWVGRTFSVGERVALEITPMAGAVFGQTNGGGIGYTGSLTWRRLDLSSETEYVFASGDAESFLYTWSELGWAPVGWFRGGFSVQRTRVYQSEFDIERGFFGTFYLGRWELSAYVFNPDAEPTVIVGIARSF